MGSQRVRHDLATKPHLTHICINMYKFMQSGYIHIYIIYIQSRYILIPIKVLCLWTKQNACLLHAVKIEKFYSRPLMF